MYYGHVNKMGQEAMLVSIQSALTNENNFTNQMNTLS